MDQRHESSREPRQLQATLLFVSAAQIPEAVIHEVHALEGLKLVRFDQKPYYSVTPNPKPNPKPQCKALQETCIVLRWLLRSQSDQMHVLKVSVRHAVY